MLRPTEKRPLPVPIAPLLAAVTLAVASALADDRTVEPEPTTVEAGSATYVGDANSNWAHIGGGFGAANTASLSLDGLSTAAQVLEPGVVLVGSLAGVVAAGEIMGTVASVY